MTEYGDVSIFVIYIGGRVVSIMYYLSAVTGSTNLLLRCLEREYRCRYFIWHVTAFGVFDTTDGPTMLTYSQDMVICSHYVLTSPHTMINAPYIC
jgi:hypothetical protein